MDPFNLAQGNLPRPRPFPAPTLPIQGTYDELLFPEKKEYIEATTDFMNQFQPQDTLHTNPDIEMAYTINKKKFLNSHGANIPLLAETPFPDQGTPLRKILDTANEEIKDTKFHTLLDGFENKHIEDVARMLKAGPESGDPEFTSQTLEGLGYEADFERV